MISRFVRFAGPRAVVALRPGSTGASSCFRAGAHTSKAYSKAFRSAHQTAGGLWAQSSSSGFVNQGRFVRTSAVSEAAVAAPTMTTPPGPLHGSVLSGSPDRYDGLIVDSTSLPEDPLAFKDALEQSVAAWRSAGVKGVWLKVPTSHAHCVGHAVDVGFEFHHAEKVGLCEWTMDVCVVKERRAACHVICVWVACYSPKVRTGSCAKSCLAKVPEYAQISEHAAIPIAETAHPILSVRITS